MKHATAEDLIPIAGLLDKIRREKRIKERKSGSRTRFRHSPARTEASGHRQAGLDFRRRNRMREQPGFSNKRRDLLQRKSYHGSLG
jgi:hypothetical protein